MPKRRQLLMAMAKLAKLSASMSDPTKARALATATIRRIASTAVAGCVSETELSFGPRFRQFIRTCLADLRADAWTEQMLQPMCIALDAAGPPLEDVPENPGFIPSPSQTSSGSAMMHEADVTPMAGVPGMLEKAFHSCCACLSAQGQTCLCGLRFCSPCLKSIGASRASLSGGQCMCQTMVVALLRGVCRQGEKAAAIKRQNLVVYSDRLVLAAQILVLAVMMGSERGIDTLLASVLEVVAAQLREKLQPALTPEQLVSLHGKHSNITRHLIGRVAKAHADQLRKRIVQCQSPLGDARPPSPRIGYLAGTVDKADLLHDVLAIQDTWLIVSGEGRSDVSLGNDLVDRFSRANRLLVLNGNAEQQAALVGGLDLGILVLTTFPDDDLMHILASRPARRSINWQAMSCSLTNLCDFTLIGSGPVDLVHGVDQRVIRVGFDQPVRMTSLAWQGHGKAKKRENVGLPCTGFVIMFPGYLVQIDKLSLWTWMQLVAGLDRSVLVMTVTAESEGMVPHIEAWVKQFADLHGPFAISRVMLLAWQGHDVHASRIAHSNLCVSGLNPMQTSSFAASVLAEGVGLLVLAGAAGSADVRASGLGALLIAENTDDFVRKGQAWASQSRYAMDFLHEHRKQGTGYFARDRVPDSLLKIFQAVLAPEKQNLSQICFDDPVPVYDNDTASRTARISGILNTIGPRMMNQVMFYKSRFEGILVYLEGQGIKICGLEGTGGSAIVLRGQLTRDLSNSAKRDMLVALKIDRKFRKVATLHNSSVLRDGVHATIMAARMRGSMSRSNLFPKPVFALFGGRSSMGYTEPDPAGLSIVFSLTELCEVGSAIAHDAQAEQYHVHGTFSNDLVLHSQELLLALWHSHRHGMLIRDIKPANVGVGPDGKTVFWDLGHGRCDAPKGGDAFGKQSGSVGLMRRNSTAHFAKDGSNPRGDANLFRGRGQSSRTVPFLFLTKEDLRRGEELSRTRRRGLGRLGNGSFTYYDVPAAEARAEAAETDPDAVCDRGKEELEDVHQAVRSILQKFNRVNWKYADEWERDARAAARNATEMLHFLHSGTLSREPQQPMMLQRFAEFFALALGPPENRPGLIELMTHLALTVPVLPPAFEQAVLHGDGAAFPGGVAGQLYPAINEPWRGIVIPPTRLLIEPDGRGQGGTLGIGLQAGKAVRDGDFVSFYCGTKRSQCNGVMDTNPTRYGVSIRSKKQKDKFSIDGFTGRKLTLRWLQDHQSTGAFMNAGDWDGGPTSNVRMDRHSAWTDPATGIVWIPMYASCDIAAGEFLRWKYSPVDGEGGVYSFKVEVQTAVQSMRG